ncbi:three-prime repair exonuclease 1 isoform X1 [Glossina fuscipes]|uniref:Three-prime repair exonuclease 1 isoform X1 n=1 Tax=Glossina fuscipes TaxID=7396 RepID=A0A8U0WGB7_9MUSC|nr:three-prime repair exonuclease 1 isoform X1 [Glossina fuscipes]
MPHSKIATFAVIDLETNSLPDLQFNKCSITELCIFAFSSKFEAKQTERQTTSVGKGNNWLSQKSIPELPRVLHKLTLMVNPRRKIWPETENITGLNNWMLEPEQPFDENTADLLISFLQRLQQPVCLVAHNGLGFDFPVLRYVMKNLDLKFPTSILCVDSWKAFQIIDAQIEINNNNNNSNQMNADVENVSEDTKRENDDEISPETTSSKHVLLPINDPINWQKINETTPHRPCKIYHRKGLANAGESVPAKRSLFSAPNPIRGYYKLGNIYKRIFQEDFKDLHRAENDVDALSKLILHYGSAFTEYAYNNAISLNDVPSLDEPKT